MPDLLLELRSEEIPARMQRKAAGDLKKLVTDGLVEAGLTYEAAREYWTPRRLTLDIRGLTQRSKDIREERKGPRTDAPQGAIDGFLRAAGLASISEAQIQSDPKKGEFYVAVISKPGRAAEEIIAGLMPGIIREFPWPKSMRSGAASEKPGSLRWVRPLQSIVCMLSTEPEEPVAVEFEVDSIRSGNITYGHRFHAPEAIIVKRFEDYAAKLERAKVVLDPERRKQIILADARHLCFAQGLQLIEDEALLEEVSGLVEWPVVLMGLFEEDYLTIPAEVIRLTIKANQKCFVTRDATGDLSNKFILVANVEASDGGHEIARGNGKVVRARLSDALYFWKTDQANLPDLDDLKASAPKFGLDLAKPLDQRMARLDHLDVTFHAKLGTQGERVLRIAKLAYEIAGVLGQHYFDGKMLDPEDLGREQQYLKDRAHRAAMLCKADLTTEVVGEFPELQGLIGRKYAELQGEHPSVAAAIEDHYKPQGPADRVPEDLVAIAVALADKLDTLVGFWAIDEKPTGSKDPFALRRAALGVIRIVLEREVKIKLLHIAQLADDEVFGQNIVAKAVKQKELAAELQKLGVSGAEQMSTAGSHGIRGMAVKLEAKWIQVHVLDLLAFFHDRLKVYLRDQGARHDLIDAVITPDADDLLAIARRVEALTAFINTADGENLVAGYKRAVNILSAEEKKGTVIDNAVDMAIFTDEAEVRLFEAVNQSASAAGQAIEKEDYSGAMQALSALREPVDSFFERVLVNDPVAKVRANRLALLAEIRRATLRVADFSKIAG